MTQVSTHLKKYNRIINLFLGKSVEYIKITYFKFQVPISILDSPLVDEILYNSNYTMIESEVYYEPYYHVLKALQDWSLFYGMSMKKYIVEADVSRYINKSSNIQLFSFVCYIRKKSEC